MPRRGHRLNDSPGGFDMIVFDKHAVAEAKAVILSPTEEHSIFFHAAQSWGCLTRIEYACRGTLDSPYTTGRNGGDTRKMSQEIERDTFRTQEGTSRAFKVSQDLVRMDSISISHQQAYDNTLIEQLKRLGCNR